MSKPLIIGVDIRSLRVAQTGTKTYLEELCREFRKLEDDGLKFRFIDTTLPVYQSRFKLFKHLQFQFWKQLVLPAKAWAKGCRILFCTDECVPLLHLGYQTVPVFHDAFCFETPEDYGRLWLWLYRNTAVPAAKRSPYVITPTAYAKKQISRYTGIPESKLAVVYEGPKELRTAEEAKPVILEQFGLSPKNYILHVGALYKRKNLPRLILAFKHLKERGYDNLKLVLAGSAPGTVSNDYEEIIRAIDDNNLQHDVVLTGYLPDSDVAGLYQHALLYVFPSLNEGFGIPVLEAFQHDLPVVAANNTCLPEVGGEAILAFDPYNIQDIVEKIATVIDSEALQNSMIEKGRERLKQFSWAKAAKEMVALFRKAAAK